MNKSPVGPGRSGCAVPAAQVIYAWPATREEFDLINAPATVHDWNQDRIISLVKNDGRVWERRVTSKLIGDLGTLACIVQWFEERPAEDQTRPDDDWT